MIGLSSLLPVIVQFAVEFVARTTRPFRSLNRLFLMTNAPELTLFDSCRTLLFPLLENVLPVTVRPFNTAVALLKAIGW